MGKRNADEFQVPNKRRLKIGKENERKNNLRDHRHASSKFVQSPVNSDEEAYQQKVVGQGAHWWSKTDSRFFRNLTPAEIKSVFQLTTSQELLQLKKYPPRKLNSYFQEELQPLKPSLVNPSLLKVLFRRQVRLDDYQNYQLGVFCFKQYDQSRQYEETPIDKNLHLTSFRVRSEQDLDLEDSTLGKLELELVEVDNRQEFIKRVLDFEVKRMQIREDVDRELQLWTAHLRQLNATNVYNWNQMKARIVQTPDQTAQIDYEVQQIKKELRMTEVLLYFKRGHGDKTEEMLEQALQNLNRKQIGIKQEQRKKRGTKIEQLKCLFETDCKICFCTESNDNNKVVYCDGCNTSFHQACYGVPEIQSKQPFFCEVCLFLRQNFRLDKQNPRSIRKPICQICCKPNFPMRQLNGHFYHITCLVLFDLVEIVNYEIKFRNALTYQTILSKVVENEINTNFCCFCLKETGMKFPCEKKCGQYFHPICAYLNGVYFQLVRNYRSLKASLSCHQHYPRRDALNQMYLRRFFCDYKNTSDKTDLEFEQIYKKEEQDRRNNLANKRTDLAQGLLKKSSNKTSKPSNRQKHKQRPEMITPSKKEFSQMLSTPIAFGSEPQLATQTRRLMNRLSQSREC